MSPAAWFLHRLLDLRIALIFFTRLPLRHAGRIEGPDLARVTWANPLVGLVVGGLSGLAFWLASWLGLPPFLAALLALAASLAATGCFHEDGLADVADGFGGGWTRARKLEIMRDSRLGTYGTAALVMALLLRAAALAALAAPELAVPALLAAHAGARAPLPLFMTLLPVARSEGLSAYAGQPPGASVAASLLLGLAVLLPALGWWGGWLALLVLLMAGSCLAWLALRQIGGYTGDVLGALEQLGEVAILLVAVALL